jgi:hypothetical protein
MATTPWSGSYSRRSIDNRNGQTKADPELLIANNDLAAALAKGGNQTQGDLFSEIEE